MMPVGGLSAKHTLWIAKVTLPENMSSHISRRKQLQAQYQSHVMPYPFSYHKTSISFPSSSSAPKGYRKPGEHLKELFPLFLKFQDDVVHLNPALFKGYYEFQGSSRRLHLWVICFSCLFEFECLQTLLAK